MSAQRKQIPVYLVELITGEHAEAVLATLVRREALHWRKAFLRDVTEPVRVLIHRVMVPLPPVREGPLVPSRRH